MGIGNRVGRVVRTPVFGIAMLTPIVLAGAVGAAPGKQNTPVYDAGVTPLAPHERAALEEINRSLKEGSQVTIVVHPRNGSDGKNHVFTLEHASAEFTRALAEEHRRQNQSPRELSADGRRQDKGVETSLELPKPRKILLQWSAEGERR